MLTRLRAVRQTEERQFLNFRGHKGPTKSHAPQMSRAPQRGSAFHYASQPSITPYNGHFVFVGKDDQLYPSGYPGLVEDIAQMMLHGVFADNEFGGNRLI